MNHAGTIIAAERLAKMWQTRIELIYDLGMTCKNPEARAEAAAKVRAITDCRTELLEAFEIKRRTK